MDEEGLVSPTESCSALGIETVGVFGVEFVEMILDNCLSAESMGELAEDVEVEGGGWEKVRSESEYW